MGPGCSKGAGKVRRPPGSIGSVDLLYLGLNIVLANVDTIMRVSNKRLK